MATSVVFPPIGGTTYSVPADGETNWATLSNYLIALASAQGTTSQKVAIRKCLTTPITVISSSDCVLNVQLTTPGAVSVVLPVSPQGQYFTVVDGTGDAATNNITVTASGGATINGSASYLITTNRASADFIYILAANNWIVRATGIVGTLPIASGGTGQITANAALNAFLPTQSGANGKVLSSDGTNSAWSTITTVIGTLPIANGGTGQITANAALNAFLPSQTSNAGKVLATDGTNSSWAAALTSVLSSAQIFVGNGSNAAVAVTMSGDSTLSNAGVLTLATVNATTGTFGSATAVTALTVNAKGLITAAASTAIQLASSAAVTGLDSALALKAPLASPTFTTPTLGVASATSVALTGGSAGNGKLWYSSGIQFGNNIGNVTDAGAWTLGPASTATTHIMNSRYFRIRGAGTTNETMIIFGTSDDSKTGAIGQENSAGNQIITSSAAYSLNLSSYSDINFSSNNASAIHGKVSAGAWTLGPAATATTHTVNASVLQTKSASTTGSFKLNMLDSAGTFYGQVGFNATGGTPNFTNGTAGYMAIVMNSGLDFGEAGGALIGKATSAGAWTLGVTPSSGASALDHRVKGNSLIIDRYPNDDAGASNTLGGIWFAGSVSNARYAKIYGLVESANNYLGLQFTGLSGGSTVAAGGFTSAGAWTLGASSSSSVQHLLQGGNAGVAAADYLVKLKAVNKALYTTATNTGMINFTANDDVSMGAIYCNNNSTTYSTSSDARRKENVATFNGLTKVMGMNLIQHSWLDCPADDISYGVLAQELVSIVPKAVSVGGDDHITQPWMVDYSKLVPIALKAIQELSAKNDALEARLAALEV